MELTVDLIEITRIPYHELETVYLSASLAIIPYGHHAQTKMSNGNKSVKFTPHRFSFIIDPIPSNSDSSLVVTVFTHLTNNHKLAISYVKIPINSIPLHSISSASLSTTLLSSFSISPIVTISLGININNTSTTPTRFKNLPRSQLQHPLALSGIDYTLCEDAPIIEFDCFGRLKPPQHYIDKCLELVESNSDFFLNLILNDSLRKTVLNKVSDRYQVNDYVSISNISSGGQQQSNVQKQNSSTPSKKSKKMQVKSSHTKNCDRPPQPPNEQPPNPRRQIRNDDSNDTSPIDASVVNQQWQQQQQQAYISQQNYSCQESINEIHPIKSQVWTVSISSKKQQQFSQSKQNQVPQQFPFVPPQQQQNSNKNESPPKSFVHTVTVDQKKRGKPQALADIEIQKPLIKKKVNDHEKVPVRGLLQPKIGSGPDEKTSINQPNKKNRSICVAPKQKQKYQNQEDTHNYNNNNEMYETSSNNSVTTNYPSSDAQPRKTSPSISYSSISSSQGQPNSNGNGNNPPSHDHRSPFMKKPRPPPQMQNSMIESQQQTDNGVSPRRPR